MKILDFEFASKKAKSLKGIILTPYEE